MSEHTQDEWLRLLRRHAKTGEPLDLIGDTDRVTLTEPADADGWPEDRRLPASILRKALMTLEARGPCRDPRGLTIVGADVTGSLDLKYARVPMPLRLLKCRFGGPVDMDYADLRALDLDGSHVRASKDSTRSGMSSFAVSLSGATVLDDVRLTSISSMGRVRMRGTHIGGHLVLRRATIHNEGGKALSLDGARIDRNVFLNEITTTGEVRMVGAHIGGYLVLEGVLFNEGGCALSLNRSRIDQNASLNPITATGEVQMVGMHVVGSLQLHGVLSVEGSRAPSAEGGLSSADNEGTARALSLDRARIDQNAFLNLTDAVGQVRMVGARIGGSLFLTDSVVSNEHGAALSLDRLRTEQDVNLDSVTATGGVRMVDAQIDGRLSLKGITVDSEGGKAINLRGARVSVLNWTPKDVNGSLVLANAELGRFVVGGPDANASSTIVADGWQLGQVQGLLANRDDAITWLGRRPDGVRFTPQPWHELAGAYERAGRAAEGQRIRTRAAWEATKNSRFPASIGRTVYGAVVGWGYRPLWSLWWLLLVLLLAWLVTWLNADLFVETRSDLDPYPKLNPAVYALETVVPPAAALQPSPWAPPGNLVYYLLLALRSFGWVLTALFLAGITGILRKN